MIIIQLISKIQKFLENIGHSSIEEDIDIATLVILHKWNTSWNVIQYEVSYRQIRESLALSFSIIDEIYAAK